MTEKRIRKIVADRSVRAVRVLTAEARDDAKKNRCRDAVVSLERAATQKGIGMQSGALTGEGLMKISDMLADARDEIARRCLRKGPWD